MYFMIFLKSRTRYLFRGGILAGWLSQYLGRRLTIMYVAGYFLVVPHLHNSLRQVFTSRSSVV